MFKFDIKLNDKDYQNFNIYHANRSITNKMVFALICFLIPLGVIYSLIRYPSFHSIDLGDLMTSTLFIVLLLINTMILAVLCTFTLMLINNLFRMIYIKLISRYGKMSYTQEQVLQFDEDSFIEVTSESEIMVKYSKIKKIGVNRMGVYIYINYREAYMIPIRFFESKADKKRFLVFLHQKSGV